MRKFLLVALCVWVAATLANAQTYSRVKQHVREYDGVAGQVEKLLPYLPTNYVVYFSDVDAVASNAAALVAGVESNLTAHAADTENPHGVTAGQLGALTAEEDAAALSAVAAVSGRVDTVEGWGDHSEAGYLTAEADAAALGVIGSATNALLDLAGTRAMTGDFVTLARDVKSRDAASVGEYGAAFGSGTTAGFAGAAFGGGTVAGDFGAAFGDGTTAGAFGAAFGIGTTAGECGAAFGDGTTAGAFGAAFGVGTTAGDYGAAFGVGTTAGEYGFAAGENASAGDHGFAAGTGTSAGGYGFAAGLETSAGDYGFAAGDSTSAGECGFAAGDSTSAGECGFAAGVGTSAGYAGFAAGAEAKGADGSFVFADNSTSGTPFDRTNFPNSFSLRVAGGAHFLIGTNWLTATNDAQTNLVLAVAGSPVLTEETDPTAVLADGTRPMTGSLDMGGNEVTGIGDAGGLLNLGYDMGWGSDFGLTYEGTEIATVAPYDGTNVYFYGNRAVSIIEGAMYVGDTESGSDLVRIDTTSIGGWGSQIAFEEGFIEGIGSWHGDLTFYNNEGETNTVDFSNVNVSGLENRVIANGDATMYWAVVDSTQLVFIANGVTNVVDSDITTP